VPAPKPISKSTRKAVNNATTGAIKPRWRPCWPSPHPHQLYARDSPSPFSNASPLQSAIPKLPSACSKPKPNSSSGCDSLRALHKNENRGAKGGGNDGRCKTLRVSHPPWKSLRDSHIPTAPTTARLTPYKIKKGAFLRHPSGLLQAHSSIRKDYSALELYIRSPSVFPQQGSRFACATKRRRIH